MTRPDGLVKLNRVAPGLRRRRWRRGQGATGMVRRALAMPPTPTVLLPDETELASEAFVAVACRHAANADLTHHPRRPTDAFHRVGGPVHVDAAGAGAGGALGHAAGEWARAPRGGRRRCRRGRPRKVEFGPPAQQAVNEFGGVGGTPTDHTYPTHRAPPVAGPFDDTSTSAAEAYAASTMRSASRPTAADATGVAPVPQHVTKSAIWAVYIGRAQCS